MMRLARFGLAGGLGFVTDLGALLLLMRAGLGPFAARALSFALAVCVTYLVNAVFTFEARESIGPRSFALYISASLGGLAVNAAVYSALVLAGFHAVPALVAASAVAMVFNYASYSRIF